MSFVIDRVLSLHIEPSGEMLLTIVHVTGCIFLQFGKKSGLIRRFTYVKLCLRLVDRY